MTTPETPAESGPPAPRGTERLNDLVRRAAKGDESTLPEIRALLDSEKGDRLIEVLGGDMARNAERAMVEGSLGKNLAAREALHRKLAALRAELTGPDPTPIERLLAERAALCWLTVNGYEAAYAQRGGDLTIAQAEFQQRRIDRAHKRYLTALRTLATMRKLAIPALQVNIARNQRINNPVG